MEKHGPQGHLKELIPELQKPNKKIDSDYSGQYDFILFHNDQFIKIEVKASRAVDVKSNDPLYIKALSSDSNNSFNMNFQQIKPKCCDVFVWTAVWRDVIKYWILSADEVENNKYYSKGQHRGNIGEGQLWITQDNMQEFADYEIKSNELRLGIVNAFFREMKNSN